MRKYLIIFFAFVSVKGIAQNTFPLNGNVGIGTATPGAKLEINTQGGNPGILISGDNDTYKD
ncbi:hypothetical protein ACI6Q2_23445, partial [Chitinophagaceae bacterium LWZ2-11]